MNFATVSYHESRTTYVPQQAFSLAMVCQVAQWVRRGLPQELYKSICVDRRQESFHGRQTKMNVAFVLSVGVSQDLRNEPGRYRL